jgi:HEPN domain-containing protein
MLRKKTSETNPADCFIMGEDRIKSADSLWKHDGLTMTGIESLQEGVERYLKGFLVAKGWRLVKTHDLERLVKEASKFEPSFAQFEPCAVELTADFFAQHYPGEDTTNVGANYEKLRAQASDLLKEIKKQLPQFFPTQ